MKNTKTDKIVPPNVKVLFLPTVYIVILLIVSIFVVRMGIDRIGKQRRELKSVQKVENTLTEKEAELRSSISVNPPLVTPASMALPDTNPALMVISNMKALAVASEITLEDFRISSGASGDTGIGKLGLTYLINGDFDGVVNFMKNSQDYLPIVQANRMSVFARGEDVEINTSAQSFWSVYPDKLPPITEPIDKITAEEYQILNELIHKQTPTFFELSPSAPSFRPNPFSI